MAMAVPHEPYFVRRQREERERQDRAATAAEAARLAADAPRFAAIEREMADLEAKFRTNDNGRRPVAAGPAPLPRPGKRPVDQHDRGITPELDAVLGTKPLNLAALKRAAADIPVPGRIPIPDFFFDHLMSTMEPAEVVVLLYIVRRTIGWHKERDAISLKQFCSGISKKDGTVCDTGTGLGRRTVQRAIRGLVEKNLILCTPVTSEHGDPDMNVYSVLPEVWPK